MPEEIKIALAKLEDIEGILAIHDEVFLPNRKKDELEEKGFLLSPINAEELKTAIQDTDNFIVLVAKKENKIIGHVLAYDLNMWRKLKPKWDEKIEPRDNYDQILKLKVIHLRHIARKDTAKGAGHQLLEYLLQTAKAKGYDMVIAEILEKPHDNKISKKLFQNRMKFKKVGTIYKDKTVDGLYARAI